MTINEGTYDFLFPYVGNSFAGIGNCEVKLIYGSSEGINQNSPYQVTFIVFSQTVAPPLEHFIENVAADIKNWFDKHSSEKIPAASIRWFQVLPYYKSGIWKQVTFDWNRSETICGNPKWTEQEPILQVDSGE